MATDGVWDFLSPSDAVRVVATCDPQNRHMVGRDTVV